MTSYLSLRRLCHATPVPGDLRLPGNRIYGNPDEAPAAEPFSRPRIYTQEDAPKFGMYMGTVLKVDPALCFATHCNALMTDGRFLAALDDVRTAAPHYALSIAPGVLAVESYHNARASAATLPHENTTAPLRYEHEPHVMMASLWDDNYAHWLLEVLPRLWYRDVCPDLNEVLIAFSPLPRSYQIETVEALGLSRLVSDVFYRQRSARIHFDRLYFPSFVAPGGYSRQQVEWLNTKLRAAFELPPATLTPLRIYVSRDDATHRRVTNEDAVTRALHAEGYGMIVPGHMSVKDQIRTFSAASEIVIAHGAAGANLVFAPPTAKVLELVPASYRHPMYWWLSQFRGLDYARLPCADTGGGKNMTVDVDKMLKMMGGLRS